MTQNCHRYIGIVKSTFLILQQLFIQFQRYQTPSTILLHRYYVIFQNITVPYILHVTQGPFNKNIEHLMRSESDKFVIRSADVRIPPDFKTFLNNGDNKERMFELIEEVWIEHCGQLEEHVVYFARGGKCKKISNSE